MESKAKWLVVGLVGIAVILVILFVIRGIVSLVGSGTNESKKTTAAKVVQPTKLTVNAANVIKNPLVYNDLTVEIDTTVSDWVTKRVFAVNAGTSTMFFGGGVGQLIIIAPNDFHLHTSSDEKGLGLGETVNVRLKGKVRLVDRAEFEKLSGISLDGTDIKLDDNGSVRSWNRGPIILLDSVEKL